MPPKKRHSRARRDKRRSSNWKLVIGSTGRCAQCGAAVTPHRVCAACGFYDGKLVVPRKVKKKKEAAGAGQGEGGEQAG